MSGTGEKVDTRGAARKGKAASSSKTSDKESGDKDNSFWRALKPSTPPKAVTEALTREVKTSHPAEASIRPIDLAGDMLELSENERESRRHALRSMLAASEARQRGSMRSRRPTLAMGERLTICSGPYKNRHGVILDADFIHSRVLLQIEEEPEQQWVEFARISAVLPN